MAILSSESARSWCSERDVSVTRDWLERLRFAQPGYPVGIRVNVPRERQQSIAMAFAMSLPASRFEDDFAGGLLWLQDWQIWSESIDRVGALLMAGLRASSSLPASIGDAPAHLFSRTEITAARAALVIPVVFEWDAWYVPDTAECLYWISHDGYIEIRFRTAADFQRELVRWREIGWGVDTIEV